MKLLDCQASIVLDRSRVLFLLTDDLLGSLTNPTLCLPRSLTNPTLCLPGSLVLESHCVIVCIQILLEHYAVLHDAHKSSVISFNTALANIYTRFVLL
jgi:hypothetical protein